MKNKGIQKISQMNILSAANFEANLMPSFSANQSQSSITMFSKKGWLDLLILKSCPFVISDLLKQSNLILGERQHAQ